MQYLPRQSLGPSGPLKSCVRIRYGVAHWEGEVSTHAWTEGAGPEVISEKLTKWITRLMNKPTASLSLDLDNKWSYMKTHGDPGWSDHPSYLDVVVPRSLEMLAELGMTITYFVVGQDAAIEANHATLKSIPDAGHEVGNHSFHHEPWLHLYSREKLMDELSLAQDHIAAVTGQRPIGFRGPGFSLSKQTLSTLLDLGIEYDCSTLPTFLGPLARTYYFWTSRLSREEKEERKILFGTIKEGFRPLRPYRWQMGERHILEIPVTTIPIIRAPFHVSYLLFLLRYSQALAMSYFRFALALCRLRGIEPSLLLHPLDFLGADDDEDLAFFPAMDLSGARKRDFLRQVLQVFGQKYDVVPMKEHASRIQPRRLQRIPVAKIQRGAKLQTV